MKLKSYEVADVAAQLKRMGLGDYYISQIVTSDLNVSYSWEVTSSARQMVRAGIGDAAIAAALINRNPEPPRTFSSDFQRFCWELDETAHQQKLDRIRRQKELEAARSQPVQRRTYEEEVTSSVLNIIDGVFEIGGLLLSQRRKK